jgi:hypothetical protein
VYVCVTGGLEKVCKGGPAMGIVRGQRMYVCVTGGLEKVCKGDVILLGEVMGMRIAGVDGVDGGGPEGVP